MTLPTVQNKSGNSQSPSEVTLEESLKTIRKEELEMAYKGIRDNSISYTEVDKIIKPLEERLNGKDLSNSKGNSRTDR